ncbi:MAG: NHL repeat-containing protein [Verrucomicrobiota bacterium]
MRTMLCLLTVGSIFSLSFLKAGESWVNEPNAILVLGQSDFGTASAGRDARLTFAHDVVVDPSTGKVFVCDTGNHRVLRFAAFESLQNGASAEAVLGQQDLQTQVFGTGADEMNLPRGIAIDGDGTLWVADTKNHRVLRFDSAAAKSNGSPADGVLGQPVFNKVVPGVSDKLMFEPSDVAVDSRGNLYVASRVNNRVIIFSNAAALPNGSSATKVLGQETMESNFASSGANGMSAPEGVALDAAGTLYVSDTGNNRVLRFDEPLNRVIPAGVARNLVLGNHANAVFGQVDFGIGTPGLPEDGLNKPVQLGVDGQGSLWVADSQNQRVIRFSNPSTAGNGIKPDRAVGQPELSTDQIGDSANRVNTPLSVSFDGQGRMWVADGNNSRILVFEQTLFRPDFSIGRSLGSLKGDNVYDPSGNSQKHTQLSKKKEAKFATLIQNDGEATDTYLVASAKTNKKIKITVFLTSGGRVNVTAATKVGAHNTGTIPASGAQIYEIKGKPRGKFRDKRRNHPVWIQATSLINGSTDRVNGVVKHRP